MQTVSSFNNWIKEKIRLHFRKSTPSFNVGEVRWCSFGENVGTEINGKGSSYTRPAYILKKFSRDSAIVIPLTSKQKTGSWYTPISVSGINGSLALNQARTISANRIFKRMATLPDSERIRIKNAYLKLIGSI